MVNYAVFSLAIFFGTCVCAAPPIVSKHFRDYEYNQHSDAFYKLHLEERTVWSAKSMCEAEGAVLMVPLTPEDIVQVHGMFKRYPDLGQYVWIASDGRDHEPAPEPAIINLSDPEEQRPDPFSSNKCDVLTRDGEIEELPCYRKMPFVCKVEAKDAPYDPNCDVYANNYHYNATVGSCYGFPLRAASWNEAYAECRAQGAHLVVLNSEVERTVVHALMQDAPNLHTARATYFFFAGFRADAPVGNTTLVYRTIFNETLSEAGFAVWSPGEPNNALGSELCGTLFKNDGLFNDVHCDDLYGFICEKEVPNTS